MAGQRRRIGVVLGGLLLGGLPWPYLSVTAVAPAEEPAKTKESQGENSAKRTAFARAVTEVRAAMAKRDVAAAKRQLQTVSANAQTEADRAQLERLQILVENLEEFWKGIRGCVARLQPVEEIELKGTRVAVVDASPQELTIHVGGSNQTYRTTALPLPLLEALVNRSFKPTPGSKVVIGSFLAVDAAALNRKQARKLFEEAAKAGEPLGKQLMPELDAPLPPGASTNPKSDDTDAPSTPSKPPKRSRYR
jgi:hypothetical protein